MTVAGEPVVNYTWDDAGRMTKLSRSINGTLKDFTFTYDNGSRRTNFQVPLYKSQGKWKYLKSDYGYDIANHLTSLLHQNPTTTVESLTYTYDPNGNRKNFARTAAQTLSPAVSSTSHDAANEMLALGAKSFTYDLNGNLQTRTDACGTTTYTWDARNRLAGISGYKPDCSALTASFSYDALNRRISKTINGTTTQFVYDSWDITQEIKAGVKTNYVRTLNIDEPLARTNSTSTRYYLLDALGSVIGLTDENGVSKTTYVYDAFGNVTTSGEASDNSFQYGGRENDGTGLYHYRLRNYSSEMQRFIQEDPIRLMGGINYYQFVQGNPLNWIDPFGLQKSCNNNSNNCYKVFYDCMVNEFLDPGLNDLLIASGEVSEHYLTAKAWQHAATRSLAYPLKSSIVRKYLSRAAKVTPVLTLVGINFSLYKCLLKEIECVRGN